MQPILPDASGNGEDRGSQAVSTFRCQCRFTLETRFSRNLALIRVISGPPGSPGTAGRGHEKAGRGCAAGVMTVIIRRKYHTQSDKSGEKFGARYIWA